MEITIGIILGILIGAVLFRRRPIGNLRVNRSDLSGEPYLFLELGADIYTIIRRKHVMLRVKVEDFLPRK